MGKYKVRKDWFDRYDSKGQRVSKWAKKANDHEIFCTMCKHTFGIGSNGFKAVQEHSSALKHRYAYRKKLVATRSRIRASSSDSVSSEREGKCDVQINDTSNKIVAAELVWVLKCIASDDSAASCDGIDAVLRKMFADAVPKEFSLNSTKFRYLVAFALEPYFQKRLMDDLSEAYYTLIYDETMNAGGRKELQISVRYWSGNRNRVVTQHLQTFFIDRATAKNIQEKIDEACDTAHLSCQKLLMLDSGGYRASETVAQLMNDKVIATRQKSLIKMGTCNIHIVHDAYLEGLDRHRQSAFHLVSAVYNFFDRWPGEWDDFTNFQSQLGLPNNHFINYVPSEWPTLKNSAERLLEQWTALDKYFLHHLPREDSEILDTNKYKTIVELLKTPTMKSTLLFVCFTAETFTQFIETFQRDEPIVHVIFAELRDLIEILLGRICDEDKIPKIVDFDDNFFQNNDNLVPLEKVVCGRKVTAELQKVENRVRLGFLEDCQKFYISACKHIIEKTQVARIPLLKYLRCLHPDGRVTKNSCNDIVELANALPLDVECDTLLDEWKLLRREKDTSEIGELRIDTYWYGLFSLKNSSGNLKYPNVIKVVKAALSLSCGSADVKQVEVFTDDRASMSEIMLNATLTIKDALKQWDNKPHDVPITEKLLGFANVACQQYRNHLDVKNRTEDQRGSRAEEEAAAKIAKEEMNEIEAEEKLLKKKRIIADMKREEVKKLLKEANEKLKMGKRLQNLAEIEVAQAMLQKGLNMTKVEETNRREVESMQASVERRKSSFIASVASKKLKL